MNDESSLLAITLSHVRPRACPWLRELHLGNSAVRSSSNEEGWNYLTGIVATDLP